MRIISFHLNNFDSISSHLWFGGGGVWPEQCCLNVIDFPYLQHIFFMYVFSSISMWIHIHIFTNTHTHTPRNHEQAVYCVCSMLTVDTIRGMYDTYTWECYRKGPKYRHIVDISYAWIIISHFLPFWQASYHAMWNCGMYPQHKTQHTKQQKYV